MPCLLAVRMHGPLGARALDFGYTVEECEEARIWEERHKAQQKALMEEEERSRPLREARALELEALRQQQVQENARKEAARAAAQKKRAEKAKEDAKNEAQAEHARQWVECSKRRFNLGTPKIGMSADDNRDCGWGEPSTINRTTTAAGRREQWVYSPRRFLYFNNGVLEAIQD